MFYFISSPVIHAVGVSVPKAAAYFSGTNEDLIVKILRDDYIDGLFLINDFQILKFIGCPTKLNDLDYY